MKVCAEIVMLMLSHKNVSEFRLCLMLQRRLNYSGGVLMCSGTGLRRQLLKLVIVFSCSIHNVRDRCCIKHIGFKQNILMYLIYFAGDLIILDRWFLSENGFFLSELLEKIKKIEFKKS